MLASWELNQNPNNYFQDIEQAALRQLTL